MTLANRDQMEKAARAFERGDHTKTEELCRAILARAPSDPDARVLLGKMYQAAGKPDAAQAEYLAAARAHPSYVEAWRHLAKLAETHGFTKEAGDYLRGGLKHSPQSSALHNDLGLIVLALGQADDAAAHLERALALSPTSISALNNLGLVRKAQRRLDDAADCYRRALAIAPHVAELHNNLGDVLKVGNINAAGDAFAAALRLRPDYPEALVGLAATYLSQGKLKDALEKFDHALRLRPDYPEALSFKAILLFLLGRLPEAWILQQRRFELSGIKGEPYGRIPVPAWKGETLAGRSLLIWTELGLGEEILQASMFADAAAQAARLTVECSPRIFSLFQRSFPDVTFVRRINPSRAPEEPIVADYQVAGGDLGGFFRQSFDAFPRHQGYLRPDPKKTAILRHKYRDGADVCVVGLSWASYNAVHGALKTLSLMDLAPLLRVPGVRFVNLQYRSNPEEVTAAEKALDVNILTDPTVDPSGDMDDVAAQVAAMDLVISVSNSTVHMAGALNVPTWNIVPGGASAMWHWFYGIAHSPWYPSMKVYRRHDQDPVALMRAMAGDLQHFVEKSMH